MAIVTRIGYYSNISNIFLFDFYSSMCQTFNEYGSTSLVWTGTLAVAKFNILGFGPDELKNYESALNKIKEEINSRTEDEENKNRYSKSTGEHKLPMVHTNTLTIIDGFITVLNHIYQKGQKFRDDFKVALVKTQEKVRERGLPSAWMKKGQNSSFHIDYNYSAHFWCLNPAVIFDELKETVRSIVLTSGTLSPMASFSSELDMAFPLQGSFINHVVKFLGIFGPPSSLFVVTFTK